MNTLLSFRRSHALQIFSIGFSSLLLAACGSSSSSDSSKPASSSSLASSSSAASSSAASNEPVAITIPFEAFSGSTEIKCGVPLEGLGKVSTRATIADFRFYVHNLRLVTSTGVELPITLDETDLQVDNIALLDFRDKLGTGATSCQGEANPAINKQVVGKVLIGNNTISSIRFVLGVPATHNHANQAAAKEPLKSPGLSSGMNWGWNIGYKFTGLDVFTDVAITRPGDTMTFNRWNIHLGSTGCTGAPEAGEAVTCTATNRAEFTLSNFVVGKSAVKLDFAKIVENSNMGQDVAGPSGCMSGATDLECAEIFASFGLAHAAQTSIPSAQTVFSVVTK
ncbi:MAG: MbnP family copper-binding protein [Cellvibrio sp.]|uniref:MbnP family copper-binding protein n=1 Tax=Cellvibrio sp. TaxID=1965322 RepID=UPI0031A0F6A3